MLFRDKYWILKMYILVILYDWKENKDMYIYIYYEGGVLFKDFYIINDVNFMYLL